MTLIRVASKYPEKKIRRGWVGDGFLLCADDRPSKWNWRLRLKPSFNVGSAPQPRHNAMCSERESSWSAPKEIARRQLQAVQRCLDEGFRQSPGNLMSCLPSAAVSWNYQVWMNRYQFSNRLRNYWFEQAT